MKNLLAVFALLLAVSSRAQTKPWIEGQHSGVKQTRAVAVQDSAKWTRIWREHDATRPVPYVDFSKENVVAVFLGQTETSGTKVAVVVQQDPYDSGRLNVFYRPVAAKNDFAAQVECQPYAIVKVPRAAFIDVERDGAVSVAGARIKAVLQGAQNPTFNAN